MFQADAGCCHWDGPMWPYAASQTLNGLANLLIDYPPQSFVTKQDYYTVLSAYAFAQMKNGQPYVAEANNCDFHFVRCNVVEKLAQPGSANFQVFATLPGDGALYWSRACRTPAKMLHPLASGYSIHYGDFHRSKYGKLMLIQRFDLRNQALVGWHMKNQDSQTTWQKA